MMEASETRFNLEAIYANLSFSPFSLAAVAFPVLKRSCRFVVFTQTGLCNNLLVLLDSKYGRLFLWTFEKKLKAKKLRTQEENSNSS